MTTTQTAGSAVTVGNVVHLDGGRRAYLVVSTYRSFRVRDGLPVEAVTAVNLRAISGGNAGSAPEALSDRLTLAVDQSIAFRGSMAAKRRMDAYNALRVLNQGARRTGEIINVTAIVRNAPVSA